METCEVIEVKYEIGPPTLCFVKLERLLSDLDAVADDAHRTITLRFHDMPDVIDFLVLKDKVHDCVARRLHLVAGGNELHCRISFPRSPEKLIACELILFTVCQQRHRCAKIIIENNETCRFCSETSKVMSFKGSCSLKSYQPFIFAKYVLLCWKCWGAIVIKPWLVKCVLSFETSVKLKIEILVGGFGWDPSNWMSCILSLSKK